jgi:hypothetical protein
LIPVIFHFNILFTVTQILLFNWDVGVAIWSFTNSLKLKKV